MAIKTIKTDADLYAVLQKMDQLWAFPIGTEEADLFEVYALLVEDYQKKLYPDDFPDPIEALQFFMRERAKTVNNLVHLLGCAERAQAIFNKQQALTTDIIWKLVSVWGMAPGALIKPYTLSQSGADNSDQTTIEINQ